MSDFTFDEINLMCIYNTGTRAGLMQALTDMRGQLEPDEAELLELTDSALRKLGRITDEQFVELEKRGIAYDVCPGVSAFCGAAASLRAEYTLPEVSQTVIITRAAGRTPVPAGQSIRELAAHRATMVLFLSTSLTEKLQEDLLAGGYPATTPAAIVYKATWPEEKIFRTTLEHLHETVTENGLTKTSLIVVGDCLGDQVIRSLLYHPGFTTEFREATQ